MSKTNHITAIDVENWTKERCEGLGVLAITYNCNYHDGGKWHAKAIDGENLFAETYTELCKVIREYEPVDKLALAKEAAAKANAEVERLEKLKNEQ